MSDDTATRLSDKLSTLELQDDEARMLLSLLSVDSDDDIQGYSFDKSVGTHRLLVALPVAKVLGLTPSSLQECTISK